MNNDKVDDFLNDLIGKFENSFRQEIASEVESGLLPQELYEQYIPVINRCIELFAWKASMDLLGMMLPE